MQVVLLRKMGPLWKVELPVGQSGGPGSWGGFFGQGGGAARWSSVEVGAQWSSVELDGAHTMGLGGARCGRTLVGQDLSGRTLVGKELAEELAGCADLGVAADLDGGPRWQRSWQRSWLQVHEVEVR